jgi:hypothetical protein
LEVATKQRLVETVTDCVFDNDLYSVVKSCVLKSPINPINPKHVYSHTQTRANILNVIHTTDNVQYRYNKMTIFSQTFRETCYML